MIEVRRRRRRRRRRRSKSNWQMLENKIISKTRLQSSTKYINVTCDDIHLVQVMNLM